MKNLTRSTLTVLLLLIVAVSKADAGEEPRQSMTTQSDGDATYQEHAPLKLQESGTGTPQKEARSAIVSTGAVADPNFWFYDVDVDLFADDDRDGFYWGIKVNFDADTNYSSADVYAVLYLSYEGGPWNEYAETDDITLLGTSGFDDYTVETELVSGYPTGEYDILIELYDAYDSSFLTSYGPSDTSELAYLPLEDSTRDSGGGTTQVVVNSGGGGALGFLLLFALLAVRMTLRPQAARLSK